MDKLIATFAATLTVLWLMLAGAPMTAAADTAQAHETILAAAQDFLAAQIKEQQDARSEIRLGKLDNRLRLAACDRPLDGFLPPGARLNGNTSVGVACNGTNPWKLYVQAYIAVFRTVAVASSYLPAGTTLDANNVRFEERDVTTGSYGYLTAVDQLRGKIMKQPVQEGRIIPPQALTKARLIRRGEEVVILSRIGNIEVRMTGNALMDGAEGDRIKVKNTKSKRIIEGKVDATGLVMVSM